MDIKEYIESGVVEAYVMGLASAEEQQQLHALMLIHPEVKQAVDDYTARLQSFYTQNSEGLSASLKQSTWERIEQEEISNKNVSVYPISEVNTLQLKTYRLYKALSVAAIILLVVSTGLNIYFYGQYKSSSDRYQVLLNEQQTLQASYNVMQAKLNNTNEALAMIMKPGMRSVIMTGVKNANETATVFWDINSKDVYVNSTKLPAAPKGYQYQLWALVEGKPVDAGMLNDCQPLCKMRTIEKADAFAITLEKEGGSKDPHLDQLHVMGKT